MDTYIVIRRGGWTSESQVEAAAARAADVGAEMAEDVCWIRSYVTADDGGLLGTVCVYQAKSVDEVREHARRADIPADEVLSGPKLIVVNPDPPPSP